VQTDRRETKTDATSSTARFRQRLRRVQGNSLANREMSARRSYAWRGFYGSLMPVVDCGDNSAHVRTVLVSAESVFPSRVRPVYRSAILQPPPFSMPFPAGATALLAACSGGHSRPGRKSFRSRGPSLSRQRYFHPRSEGNVKKPRLPGKQAASVPRTKTLRIYRGPFQGGSFLSRGWETKAVNVHCKLFNGHRGENGISSA